MTSYGCKLYSGLITIVSRQILGCSKFLQGWIDGLEHSLAGGKLKHTIKTNIKPVLCLFLSREYKL